MTSPDDQEVNIVNLSGLNNKFVMKLNGKPIDILRVLDLKEGLAKRDLPKHGNKQQQVQRLAKYLQQNPNECDTDGHPPNGRKAVAAGAKRTKSAAAAATNSNRGAPRESKSLDDASERSRNVLPDLDSGKGVGLGTT